MGTDALEELVRALVVVAMVLVAATKQAMVALMASAREKLPLDRAVIANQQTLAIERWLWAALLVFTVHYREHRLGWLIVWLAVTLAVLGTTGWMLVALWRERLRPAWRRWREGRR
jgi:hypothetical protein